MNREKIIACLGYCIEADYNPCACEFCLYEDEEKTGRRCFTRLHMDIYTLLTEDKL